MIGNRPQRSAGRDIVDPAGDDAKVMVVKQLDDTETELGGVLVITPGVITEAADRLGHARDLRFDFRGDDLTVQRFARGASCQRFQCVVNLTASTGAPGSPYRIAVTYCQKRRENQT